jgi:hypothetical protein
MHEIQVQLKNDGRTSSGLSLVQRLAFAKVAQELADLQAEAKELSEN